MFSNRLLNEFRTLLDILEEKELGVIDRLADLTAESIAKGGAIFVHDRGHLLNHELFMRSGGLALLQRLEKSGDPANELLQAKHILEHSVLKAGDVLILSSVSGRATSVVELAILAKQRGVTTIALTALDYTSQTESKHPSGQRLYEVCDHVLDIHTQKGDAALVVDGLDEKIIPTSGFTSAVVAWCFIAQLIENLLKRSVVPTVYRSVSMPEGEERLERAKKRYAQLGY
ncbi:MAG: sugar isomerase protein [Paenibacillus sp.]|jgi:uncharacterized phosphosugar-binding protein|nr:sugar isomerase protein [Paenibacillus sp.]